MDNYELYLGSHINLAGPLYYLGTVKDALSYGENTFMFYTGAPQNTFRKPTSELNIADGRELIKSSGLNENKIIVHAPYIINLANVANPSVNDLARSFLLQELRRVNDFHIKTLVLHPGSHVGAGAEIGLNSVVENLNFIFANDNTDVKIALETMAGKGSEVGTSFEQIAYIIKNCKYPERLGVCIDTCHLNDDDYDVKDVDGVLDEFDRIIGLDKLLVVHLNDSKNEKGSHKDRHANLGMGTIGFDTLYRWTHHPKLNGIPKILETPYINEKPPYKEEINMLRNGVFDPNWINKY